MSNKQPNDHGLDEARQRLARRRIAPTIAVTLPEKMLEQLTALAQLNGWNRSEAIRQGVLLLFESHLLQNGQ